MKQQEQFGQNVQLIVCLQHVLIRSSTTFTSHTEFSLECVHCVSGSFHFNSFLTFYRAAWNADAV